MKKINFKNNGQPAINDTNLNLVQDNIENELNAKVNTSDLIDLIYPVGSIYMSVNSTNPSTLFGGTWEQIARGRTLVGEGIVEDNNDNWCGKTKKGDWTAYAGHMGGEVTHTLTVDEMPSHNHKIPIDSFINSDSQTDTFKGGHVSNQAQGTNYNTASTGGNQPHNNMPPYLAVYMWKRIS